MVALTRLLSVLVRWFAGSRRRRVALLAVPVLIVVALAAPRPHRNNGPLPGGVLAGSGTRTGSGETRQPTDATASLPAPTVLPATTGTPGGPAGATRPASPLSPDQAAAAVSYVMTVNSHDARPGRDTGPLDSYRRARPYVTGDLYALITASSQRGDYQWSSWAAEQATVSVAVLRVAVPDGAPTPTASTAYVRVLFRQQVTPHAAAGSPSSLDGEVSLLISAQPAGRWLVSRLLPNT